MSAAAPQGVATISARSAQSVLARRLLRCALDILSAVSGSQREPALIGIDRFLAAPSPATFLSAMRILRQVQQSDALRHARLSRAEQDFARGLETVRRELGSSVADVLSALPLHDDKIDRHTSASPATEAPLTGRSTGARLRALALLAAAHHELADRVAGSADKLRQYLARANDAQERLAEKPAPRRRTPTPRSLRHSTTTSTKK